MTIKEAMAIAKNDEIMDMLRRMQESFRNDCHKTVYELQAEGRKRKEMARTIRDMVHDETR